MWKKLIIGLASALFLISCNSEVRQERREQRYNWVLKNGTVDQKYNMAIDLFEEKDYFRCTSLLEDVISYKSGTKEFEDVLFLLAEAYFYQEQYLLANHYYERFVYKFPRHEKVEDADFMSAKSLYMISPKISLDQTETKNAIIAFENFLIKYPDTEKREECRGYIEELEKKIEDKSYETAKLHLKIKNYKAAVTSFDIFIKEYPNSEYNEELSYLKIEAQLELAKISLETVKKDGKTIYLQKERFEEVKDFYKDFEYKYPESEYLKDAKSLYEVALENTKTE